MIESCMENGVKLAVAHQHRFNPVNTLARKLVADGLIGKPLLIHKRTEGGLLNNGSHLIDTARYWLSDIEAEWVMGQVERKTDRYERGTRTEDLCSGLVYFKGGTRLIVEVDTPTPLMAGEDFYDTFIFGSEGTVRLSEEGVSLQNPGDKGWRVIDAASDTNEFAELIDWIEGKRVHRCNAGAIRGTMEIMMAIYESVRVRGLVRLPLVTEESPLEMMVNSNALPVEKPGKYDIRLPRELWGTLK
jgi:predicted dehydrogenase